MKLIYSILILFLGFSPSALRAQEVFEIPDSAFRGMLDYYWPESFNEDGLMYVDSAVKINGNILYHAGDILSFEGLQYFPLLEGLTVRGSKVEVFDYPLPSMYHIDLRDNKLKVFEVSGLSPSLELAYVQGNELEYVPDLSGFEVLRSADFSNNRLTFEDIVPVYPWGQDTAFDRFLTVFPQKRIVLEDSIVGTIGYEATISLGVDENVSGNVYEWYKDSVFFTTTDENKLVFEELTEEDAGDYFCRITNTAIPDSNAFLTTEVVRLSAEASDESDFLLESDVDPYEQNLEFSPDGDGINDRFYLPYEGSAKILSMAGVPVKTLSLPAFWDGTDNNGAFLPTGYYYIQVNDGQLVPITIFR